jgi:hypothetical protein
MFFGTLVLALSGLAGCTLVLDKQKAQCVVDADCALDFGGHPLCQQGVCVESGLGPEGCVDTTLKAGSPQTDFLNACSTSKCVPFSNCDRLKICESSKTLPPEQNQMTVKRAAPVNPVAAPPAAPEGLCTTGAPGGGANVVYLYGSADFGPLLHAAQPSLSAAAVPYRAVFQGSTSCNGVAAAFDPVQRTTLMKDPAMENAGGWAFYFDDNGRQVNCRLGGPTTVDIGISNLFSQTCDPSSIPSATVVEYTGPVVPFVLSVPATSGEQSISAEAAHLVFGLGGIAPPGSGMTNASPWTDWNNYYIRNSGAGSTVLTALMIGVDKTKFWGVDTLSTENLRDSLLAAPAASVNASIGILSIDFNDKNRGNLKALYLQDKGQLCGYQPDSSPTTFDKVNVRDGHYPLWGYVHFFTPDPNGRARNMTLLFNAQRLDQSLLDGIIDASLIPQCALKVARTSEMGNFAVRTGFQCGCYFDFKTKDGKTSCQTCKSSEDCPSVAPACNYGYCEAQ